MRGARNIREVRLRRTIRSRSMPVAAAAFRRRKTCCAEDDGSGGPDDRLHARGHRTVNSAYMPAVK